MDINKLHEIYMRLKTATVLSDFTVSNIGESLEELLELAVFGDYSEDGAEILKAYSVFNTLIYDMGGDLGLIIKDFVSSGDNLYIDKYLEKKVTPEMDEALSYDLKTMEMVSKISSEDFAPVLAPYLSEFKSISLPKWINTGVNVKKEFNSLIKNLSTSGYGIFLDSYMLKIKDSEVVPVDMVDYQSLDELYGYERERNLVLKNTEAFVKGEKASNVLLYGDAGTGKSTTVKACAGHFGSKGLRLIEFSKSQVGLIPDIAEELSVSPLRFIFFIDDLTFNENDEDYYALKGILEGNVRGTGSNVLIYATSNRRHLVKESMESRDKDIHLNDALQETLSLSSRFGLTITFSKPEKELYLLLVENLANEYGLTDGMKKESKAYSDYMTLLKERAEAYAIRSNGRSPRTAKQFIKLYKNNLG